MCGYLTKRDQETRRNETNRKKKGEKEEGTKNADCSLDGEEARSTNPAASMAAANGRERRPEPGGNHGGWDGAAEVVCQGRGRGDVKDQKGETPLARGDLSPALGPGRRDAWAGRVFGA